MGQFLCKYYTDLLSGSLSLTKLLETNVKGPMFSRGPPSQHKQPLCGYTEQLCGSLPLTKVIENNFKCLMFNRGTTPHPPVFTMHNTTNDCVPTRNHCAGNSPSKNYCKTTLITPCLPGVLPPPSQQLCGYTTPLCGSISL